jgi:2-hydroxy-3-keto-5-methylthiopentenyl-1-phosphate phosphatase
MCVSDTCDIVFAKASLLSSRTARGLQSRPFTSFADICALLPSLVEIQGKGLAKEPPNFAAIV